MPSSHSHNLNIIYAHFSKASPQNLLYTCTSHRCLNIQQSVESQCTLRSPDMLAPARIPVAAGKNTANTMKKFSMSEAPPNALKLGTKLVRNVFPEDKFIITILITITHIINYTHTPRSVVWFGDYKSKS